MGLIQKLRTLRKNIQTGNNTDLEAIHILKECLVEPKGETDIETAAYLEELEKLGKIKSKFTTYAEEVTILDTEYLSLQGL